MVNIVFVLYNIKEGTAIDHMCYEQISEEHADFLEKLVPEINDKLKSKGTDTIIISERF